MVQFSIIWLLKIVSFTCRANLCHLQRWIQMETQLRFRLRFVSVLPGQIFGLLILDNVCTMWLLYIRMNGWRVELQNLFSLGLGSEHW